VLRALLTLTTPITCGSYNTNTGNENKMLFVWIGRFYTQLTQVGRENFHFPFQSEEIWPNHIQRCPNAIQK